MPGRAGRLASCLKSESKVGFFNLLQSYQGHKRLTRIDKRQELWSDNF